MNRITKMFFDGKISHNLLKRWEQYGSGITNHTNLVWHWTSIRTDFWRSLVFTSFLFISLFISLGLPLSEFKKGVIISCSGPGITLFVALVLFSAKILKYKFDHFADKDPNMRKLPDRRFCDDIEKLIEKIGFNVGSIAIPEIKKIICEKLVGIAKEVIKLQLGGSSLSALAEERRTELRKAHKIFLKFGLAEEDWDVYFNPVE